MAWVRAGWCVALGLIGSSGLATAGGCSGDVDPPAQPVDAAGGSAGRGGSSGSGGTAGRGGSSGRGPGTDATAGRGGTSGGFGGTSGGFGGTSGGFGGTFAGASGSNTGGASGSGTGGSGGIIVDCFPPDTDFCVSCLQVNCCSEFMACAEDSACQGDGEITCIQACVQAAVAGGGVADNTTIARCAAMCAFGGTIASATNDLLACMVNGVRADGGVGADCFVECLAGG